MSLFLFFSAGISCVVCRGDNGVYILVNYVPSLGPSRVVVDGQAHYLLERVEFAIREVSVLGVPLCALLGRKPSEEGVYWKRAFRTARPQCRVDAFVANCIKPSH